MYLTDAGRPFTFPEFVKHFSQCKYISEILLLVLTHDNDSQIYYSLLKDTNLNFKVIQVPVERNYLQKISITFEVVKSLFIPYIMKHDNDILMSKFIYDSLFEKLDVLENPKNLLLTPTLTSGIPTCDMFLEDFCSADEQKRLGDLFLQYRHTPIWGTDYSELNKYTLEAKEWDAKNYYHAVKEREHHYKGIHPVRMSKDCICLLNEYVIKYKDRIFSNEQHSLFYDNTSPYFCNSVFCIKASLYQEILSHAELYVDPFDEVPLNKWRDRHNLNLVILRNGVAVHPFYNTIPNYIELERSFIQKMV